MKKQFFGALALALMISVTSCRDNNEATEESMDETSTQDEANLEMNIEETSEIIETETPVDSVATPATEIEQDTPQI